MEEINTVINPGKPAILEILAIIISASAFAISIYFFIVNKILSIRPVLVFYNLGQDEKGENLGWYVRNCGSGVAVNVVIMAGDEDLSWDEKETTLYSAIPKDDTIKLTWSPGVGSYYANYENIHGKKYSSLVVGNKNTIIKGYEYESKTIMRNQYETESS